MAQFCNFAPEFKKASLIAYIKGTIAQITPTFVVLENNGIGYHVNISLQTHAFINGKKEVCLFIHHYIKEESLPMMYGFSDEVEKHFFLDFISVSGVGPNTAIVILSTFNPSEIREAVVAENVNMLKSIKGIGPKSAKRIILELKDKFLKIESTSANSSIVHNTQVDEALQALGTLGISRSVAQKAIKIVLQKHPEIDSVEEIVKYTLKNI